MSMWTIRFTPAFPPHCSFRLQADSRPPLGGIARPLGGIAPPSGGIAPRNVRPGAAYSEAVRFYDELAAWWPLFSPPSHYTEEAADLLERLRPHVTFGAATLLELGSGGGSL